MVREMLPAGLLPYEGSAQTPVEQLLYDYHDGNNVGIRDLSVCRNDRQTAVVDVELTLNLPNIIHAGRINGLRRNWFSSCRHWIFMDIVRPPSQRLESEI